MKTTKLNKKLSLHKETLSKLNEVETKVLEGGKLHPTTTVRHTFYLCHHTHTPICHYSVERCTQNR